VVKAMILAAGRGERMRPLSDATPKPLLTAGGKALIAWQLERLIAAGFRDIVVNVAHRGHDIEAALGDGSRFGAAIRYSREREPLEVAGGIATALPLLGDGIALVVSGDIFTDYDYASLRPRLDAMAERSGEPHMHMVMVPNPPYHPRGDFALNSGKLRLDGETRVTFGNIALYRTRLFEALPRGVKLRMLPLYQDWIDRGWATGESFTGRWFNVGTPGDLADLDRELRSTFHERPAA
jgi:N-acetyl-alpha-D-muramate 1-phosphate uridylyltransferase